MDDSPEVFRGTGGQSTLQRIVRAHLDEFLTEFVDEHGGRSLPGYVTKEFQALLECGDPAFGFCRIRCPSCTTDMILPFSCKGRTFCSSCGGRQMAQSTDDSNYEQPLLDFGDARDGPFFPSLKSASVQSAVPFGPRAGQPLRRLKDPDLARAFEAAGWPSQRVSPPLVANENGFSLHAATRVRAGERDRLEKLCRYVTRPALCLQRLEVRSDGQTPGLCARLGEMGRRRS